MVVILSDIFNDSVKKNNTNVNYDYNGNDNTKNLAMIITSPWMPIVTEDFSHRFFKAGYLPVAPVNLSLCVLIILLNSLVLSQYFRKRTRATFVLFILISISDILTALGNAVFAGGVLVWSRDPDRHDTAMWWCMVVYRVIGLGGYSFSILLNTFLAVLRCIKICSPFHRVRMRAVVVVGVLYLIFLLTLTGYDLNTMYQDHTFNSFLTAWVLLVSFTEMYPHPGQTLSWDMSSLIGSNVGSKIMEFTLLAVLFVLPVLAVVFSVVIQVVVVEKLARKSRNSVVTTLWSHVNNTVLLLAGVFLLCNLATTVVIIITAVVDHLMEFDVESSFKFARLMFEIQAPLSTMMPLLNAFLTPVIIVARKKQSQRFMKDIFVLLKNMSRFGTHTRSE